MPTVTHLDADAFFASVEQAADPRLRGQAHGRGGGRSAASLLPRVMRRAVFGIYTPMPTVRCARKLCPRLIVLPGDFEKYERFRPLDVQLRLRLHTPRGDWLHLMKGTSTCPARVGPRWRSRRPFAPPSGRALKITVSEGIGSSKLISQIASKYRKPAAFEHVPPGCERAFLHPLPNKWLPGVGPKTAARFNAAGLTHIHHIAATPVDRLSLLGGANRAAVARVCQRG